MSHHLARGTNHELNDLEEIGKTTCSQTNNLVCLSHVPDASGTQKYPLNSIQ
jgi:hypothetical protein